jgi:hypothetical protein
VVRVLTAGETSEAIARANRALAEICAGEALDAQQAAEQRAAQLARRDAADDEIRADRYDVDADEQEPLALDRAGGP